jgi:signal transduction histidine kinase
VVAEGNLHTVLRAAYNDPGGAHRAPRAVGAGAEELGRMKIGIRTKLVALLVVVALLPLVTALGILAVGGRHLAIESFGKVMSLTAAAEVAELEAALRKDVEKLEVVLQHDPSMVRELAERTERLTPERLAELDARWPKMPAAAEPLAGVLAHPLAVRARRLQQQDARFAEVFVTDRFGQLVAATGRTSDFYQGDEGWWRSAFCGGRGCLFIPPVSYDDSAAVWSVDICAPIRQGARVVGVAKASLDVSRWLHSQRIVEQRAAGIMVVRGDGAILSREGTRPLTQRAGHWAGEIATASQSGWRLTPDGEIQGYAPIRLPGRMFGVDVVAPRWVLVAYVPRSAVLADVRWLSGVALATGLGVIAALFLAGLLLVNRSIVRRILQLARATHRVTEGDLEHRIRPRWAGRRLLGTDEIDELAADFNRMVGRIQRSHRELAEANELKMNFIRVASHELRTPVGYVLSMARMLCRCEDPQRLRKAVATMGVKAERLNDIIQAMFKLMPQQRYLSPLQYGQVRVSELLEDVRRDCQPFAEQRRQQLAVEDAEALGSIQADADKLRDVLVNLVMNAVKFTPDGGTITLRAGEELGGHVSISVVDQGSGIPPRELEHIFDPFFSGGDVLKHSTGVSGHGKRGMGLGLAVVQHFVELHGGHVNVHSTSDGCTFTVTVPTERPAQSERPPEPAPRE